MLKTKAMGRVAAEAPITGGSAPDKHETSGAVSVRWLSILSGGAENSRLRGRTRTPRGQPIGRTCWLEGQ